MLIWCWASVADAGPTTAQQFFNVSSSRDGVVSSCHSFGGGPPAKTGHEHVLVQCWPSVSDAATLKQHEGNVTCLLGGAHGANRSVTIQLVWWGVTDLIVCIHLRLTLGLPQQRAIVVICSAHVTANSQYQMLSGMGHHRAVGPMTTMYY